MAGDMPEHAAGEYRAALEAIREALAVPYPATVGDEPAQRDVLARRVMHVVVALDAVLGERPGGIAWQVAYLRDRVAECPATGYRTWDEAVAQRRAAEAEAARPASGGDVIAFDMDHGDEGPVLEADDDDD